MITYLPLTELVTILDDDDDDDDPEEEEDVEFVAAAVVVITVLVVCVATEAVTGLGVEVLTFAEESLEVVSELVSAPNGTFKDSCKIEFILGYALRVRVLLLKNMKQNIF